MDKIIPLFCKRTIPKLLNSTNKQQKTKNLLRISELIQNSLTFIEIELCLPECIKVCTTCAQFKNKTNYLAIWIIKLFFFCAKQPSIGLFIRPSVKKYIHMSKCLGNQITPLWLNMAKDFCLYAWRQNLASSKFHKTWFQNYFFCFCHNFQKHTFWPSKAN